MSLVAQVLKETSEREAERRKAAFTVYRDVLAHEATPKAGDAERLLEAMRVLGRTLADLAADSSAVANLERLEQLAAAHDTRWQAQVEANRKHGEILAWAARERAKLEASTREKLAAAANELSVATLAASESRKARVDLPDAHDWVSALIANTSVEEVKAARLAEAKDAATTSAGVARRAEVLRASRNDYVTGGSRPLTGSIQADVDATLARHGMAPLSASEFASYFGETGAQFETGVATQPEPVRFDEET